MDVHNIEGGVAKTDGAKVYEADLSAQVSRGVQYRSYWVTNAHARSSAWSRLRLPSRLPTCTARRAGWSPMRFSTCPRP